MTGGSLKIALIYLDPSVYGSGHFKRLTTLKKILVSHEFFFKEVSVSNLIDLERALSNLYGWNLILDLCAPLFILQAESKSYKFDTSRYFNIISFEGIATSRLISSFFKDGAISIFPYLLERDSPLYQLEIKKLIGPEYHLSSILNQPITTQINPKDTLKTNNKKYKILLTAGFTDPSHITARILDVISSDPSLSAETIVWFTSTDQPSYDFDRKKYPFAIDIKQQFFNYLPRCTHVVCSSGLIKYDCLLSRTRMLCVHPDLYHDVAHKGFEEQTGTNSVHASALDNNILIKFLINDYMPSIPGWDDEDYKNALFGAHIKKAILGLF